MIRDIDSCSVDYMDLLVDTVKKMGLLCITWKADSSDIPYDISKYIKDDADHVTLVIAEGEYIPFLESHSYGCFSVKIHDTEWGRLYIGYHS